MESPESSSSLTEPLVPEIIPQPKTNGQFIRSINNEYCLLYHPYENEWVWNGGESSFSKNNNDVPLNLPGNEKMVKFFISIDGDIFCLTNKGNLYIHGNHKKKINNRLLIPLTYTKFYEHPKEMKVKNSDWSPVLSGIKKLVKYCDSFISWISSML